MNRILLPFLSLFFSFTLTAQDLTIEILTIINADSINLNFIQSDTILIPDGTGVSIETSILIEGFDTNEIIQSSSDIAAIGMIMEHSYLGDLDILIYCPTGQSLELKTFPGGGGAFLGEPIDTDSDLNPGVGYYYMYKNNAVYLDIVSESNNYLTMPEGSYLWIGESNSLIGCPLNGEWTLEMVDNLNSDNGYLFNWQLFFDPAIVPDSLNNGSVIIDILGGTPPGQIQTDWYVEWSNGRMGLVNDKLAPGEYTAWLKEEVTNVVLDSIHVTIGSGGLASSIQEINDDELSIYPNPVKDELAVNWKFEEAIYTIISIEGKVFNQGLIQQGLNKINTSNLSSGMYILQVNSSTTSTSKRFIKR